MTVNSRKRSKMHVVRQSNTLYIITCDYECTEDHIDDRLFDWLYKRLGLEKVRNSSQVVEIMNKWEDDNDPTNPIYLHLDREKGLQYLARETP